MTTTVWVLFLTALFLSETPPGPDVLTAVYISKESCESRANKKNAADVRGTTKYLCMADVVLP